MLGPHPVVLFLLLLPAGSSATTGTKLHLGAAALKQPSVIESYVVLYPPHPLLFDLGVDINCPYCHALCMYAVCY